MASRVAGRSTRRQGDGASERIKAMVDEKLDQGLEYEALQLYKGQAARKVCAVIAHCCRTPNCAIFLRNLRVLGNVS
jgi:hypothetical protein